MRGTRRTWRRSGGDPPAWPRHWCREAGGGCAIALHVRDLVASFRLFKTRLRCIRCIVAQHCCMPHGTQRTAHRRRNRSAPRCNAAHHTLQRSSPRLQDSAPRGKRRAARRSACRQRCEFHCGSTHICAGTCSTRTRPAQPRPTNSGAISATSSAMAGRGSRLALRIYAARCSMLQGGYCTRGQARLGLGGECLQDRLFERRLLAVHLACQTVRHALRQQNAARREPTNRRNVSCHVCSRAVPAGMPCRVC